MRLVDEQGITAVDTLKLANRNLRNSFQVVGIAIIPVALAYDLPIVLGWLGAAFVSLAVAGWFKLPTRHKYLVFAAFWSAMNAFVMMASAADYSRTIRASLLIAMLLSAAATFLSSSFWGLREVD